MKVTRTEDARVVHINVFDAADTTGWNGHRLSCAVADMGAGPLFHKPGRVHIWPMSFGNGTPEDLRAYARDLLELADIADALQAEMTARYTKEYGGG